MYFMGLFSFFVLKKANLFVRYKKEWPAVSFKFLSWCLDEYSCIEEEVQEKKFMFDHSVFVFLAGVV